MSPFYSNQVVASSTPCLPVGSERRRRQRQEVGNGATHLPPTEVFYLLVFVSVLQRVGARWLLEEEVVRVAHRGRLVMFSVFRSVSAVWVKLFAKIWPVAECPARKSSVQMVKIRQIY